MTDAERLRALIAAATPGPWLDDGYRIRAVDGRVLWEYKHADGIPADAALCCIMRAIAEPLAEWAEADTAFNAIRAGDAGSHSWAEALADLQDASAALLSALSAALKELP
jgi:hypothetical protein